MLTTHKKGSEGKLLEIINSIKDEPHQFFSLHFCFSELLEHYKNDYQLKISVNIINDLLKNARGWIVVTTDYDIFVICKQTELKIIKKLVFQLRYLYMDDPLSYDEQGEDNPRFVKIYELANQWTDFFSSVRAKLKALESERPRKVIEIKPQTLTPEKLVNIEGLIGKSNISPALRQQPVCFENADGLRIMFTETYINMASLAELLGVNVDFVSNRWLFKYFTELLDFRVIELIKKTPAKFVRRPISLNLNVHTILSEMFIEFATKLDENTKKNIVIEIQVADVFTSMAAFQAARDIMHKHGFRLCLDGVDVLSFRQLDRSALGFDLAKIQWNADFKTDSKNEQNLLLQKAVANCGKARVILCRCDSKDAVDYGKSLGISLFQGRYIDSKINPESDVRN